MQSDQQLIAPLEEAVGSAKNRDVTRAGTSCGYQSYPPEGAVQGAVRFLREGVAARKAVLSSDPQLEAAEVLRRR